MRRPPYPSQQVWLNFFKRQVRGPNLINFFRRSEKPKLVLRLSNPYVRKAEKLKSRYSYTLITMLEEAY